MIAFIVDGIQNRIGILRKLLERERETEKNEHKKKENTKIVDIGIYSIRNQGVFSKKKPVIEKSNGGHCFIFFAVVLSTRFGDNVSVILLSFFFVFISLNTNVMSSYQLWIIIFDHTSFSFRLRESFFGSLVTISSVLLLFVLTTSDSDIFDVICGIWLFRYIIIINWFDDDDEKKIMTTQNVDLVRKWKWWM